MRGPACPAARLSGIFAVLPLPASQSCKLLLSSWLRSKPVLANSSRQRHRQSTAHAAWPFMAPSKLPAHDRDHTSWDEHGCRAMEITQQRRVRVKQRNVTHQSQESCAVLCVVVSVVLCQVRSHSIHACSFVVSCLLSILKHVATVSP